MRLKFLFFPLMLILSLVVVVSYIWPKLGELRTAKASYADSVRLLGTIKENEANIKSMNADLTTNSGKTDLVMGYFPLAKSEEKIVDSLNYLATGAGLSVVGIGLEKDTALPAQNAPVVQAAPMTSLAGQGGAPSAGQPSGTATNELNVKLVGAHATVVGEYEKIMMYVDQIQKMGMFNAITKIEIAPKKDDKAQGVMLATQQQTVQQSTAPGLLLADITVSFKYAPRIKNASIDESQFTSARFDFAPVDKLQDYISQGGTLSPMPQIQVGAVGKANPFLP